MNVKILELIEGAKQAEGLAVIIDVFRAFSLECYLFDRGAKVGYPMGDLEEAFAMKKTHSEYLLIGERGGKRVEGCDYGNSPSQTQGVDLKGRSFIHTTSAGTQGIMNARRNADEIMVASLVNARAVASYIYQKNPQTVSIVAMGQAGIESAGEDVLCAEYLKYLLLEDSQDLEEVRETGWSNFANDHYDIQEKAENLRMGAGAHFFDPDNQEVFPREDFDLSTDCNRFGFVIPVTVNAEGRMTTHPLMVLQKNIEN